MHVLTLTRGPGRSDTCHLTDFGETWPDCKAYPITQRAKTVSQLQFANFTTLKRVKVGGS